MGNTLSAKCTKNTKKLLWSILSNEPFFVELPNRFIVYPNPSWLIKFSIITTLKQLRSINKFEDLEQITYDSHYVDNFDSMLKNFLIEREKSNS